MSSGVFLRCLVRGWVVSERAAIGLGFRDVVGRRGRWLLVPATVSVAVCAGPASSWAATYTVTSVANSADRNPADGRCEDVSGQCTLRAAIEQANANPASDGGGPDRDRITF